MSSRPISDFEKLACAERELQFRHRVYSDRVRRGLMQQHQAEREIELMKAIAADYREKVQPGLFIDGLIP